MGANRRQQNSQITRWENGLDGSVDVWLEGHLERSLSSREHTLEKCLRPSDKIKRPDGRERQEAVSQNTEWNILGERKEKKIKILGRMEGNLFRWVVLSYGIYTHCFDTNNPRARSGESDRKLTVSVKPYLRRHKKRAWRASSCEEPALLFWVILYTNHSLFSFRSSCSLPPPPIYLPIHSSSLSKRGRLPMGVKKACHITLRPDQAPPPPSRRSEASLHGD